MRELSFLGLLIYFWKKETLVNFFNKNIDEQSFAEERLEFSESVKNIIKVAEKVAEESNSKPIEIEALLLAFLLSKERSVAEALNSNTIPEEQVKEQIERAKNIKPLNWNDFLENKKLALLSSQIVDCLILAENLAKDYNSKLIKPEHLFLALLNKPQVVQILEGLNFNCIELKLKVSKAIFDNL